VQTASSCRSFGYVFLVSSSFSLFFAFVVSGRFRKFLSTLFYFSKRCGAALPAGEQLRNQISSRPRKACDAKQQLRSEFRSRPSWLQLSCNLLCPFLSDPRPLLWDVVVQHSSVCGKFSAKLCSFLRSCLQSQQSARCAISREEEPSVAFVRPKASLTNRDDLRNFEARAKHERLCTGG